MKTTLFAVFSTMIAALVFNLAICLAIITMQSIGWDPNEGIMARLAIFVLPALATGMILSRVQPSFPRLSAPLGSMTVVGCMAVADGAAPIWVRLGLVAMVGIVSLLGCTVLSLKSKPKKPQPPTSNIGRVPTASPA